MPTPLPFLLASVAEQISCGMEYPFGEFGSAVLAMCPPKILPTPQPTGEGEPLERQP